ncbi:YeeE/YedE family protein [Mycoplasmatota bacterium]|nr:YeeE/YedE family protein [Mycoplasmatota bacterium]
MKKTVEYFLGFVLLTAIVLWGRFGLSNSMLFFRLLAGLGLGYALTRSLYGFAGSVNRMCHTGSTKLMRVLVGMFLGSAIVTAGILLMQDPAGYDLWVNPINLGLILGGLLFGFGMAFCFCCASGVLTDLVTGLPRALITLIFFGLGVFLGFPVQSTAGWVKNSWFTTAVGEKLYGGVYLPDLFKWDGLNGYLGAIILTAILSGIVVLIAKIYEDRRKARKTYTGTESEIIQYQTYQDDEEPFKLFSKKTYEKLFVRPWTLGVGATVIGAIFVLLMNVTKAGWGASTPYGFWFGRLLTLFGASPEKLASFTNKPVGVYTMPFFDHPINVQNVGIILGTLIALLLAGNFVKSFKGGLSITFKDGIIFAIGGLCMGFGTRLSNGCNVGALYTPIANFSLSGWIFFIFLIGGGIIGYKVNKKLVVKK